MGFKSMGKKIVKVSDKDFTKKNIQNELIAGRNNTAIVKKLKPLLLLDFFNESKVKNTKHST